MWPGMLLIQQWRRQNAGILSQNGYLVKAASKCWTVPGRLMVSFPVGFQIVEWFRKLAGLT